MALDLVRNGAILGHGHVEHVLLGVQGSLGDSQGHLSGLTHAKTNIALTIAHDNESDEGHAATALDGLGNTVDENDALLELGGLALLLITSHVLQTS